MIISKVAMATAMVDAFKIYLQELEQESINVGIMTMTNGYITILTLR